MFPNILYSFLKRIFIRLFRCDRLSLFLLSSFIFYNFTETTRNNRLSRNISKPVEASARLKNKLRYVTQNKFKQSPFVSSSYVSLWLSINTSVYDVEEKRTWGERPKIWSPISNVLMKIILLLLLLLLIMWNDFESINPCWVSEYSQFLRSLKHNKYISVWKRPKVR